MEARHLLSGFQPTAQEQLFLELVNDGLANPAAYGQSIGRDLSRFPPMPPVAFDLNLVEAARLHSQDMHDRNYCDTVTPEGGTPDQRVAAAGYAGAFLGEAVKCGYASDAEALAAMVRDAVDAGLPDPSKIPIPNTIGVGIVLGGGNYWTVDAGLTNDRRRFLTGVVFQDNEHTGHYDVGEGLGGVTITVAGAGATSTFASGGYELRLNPGTYAVTASGGGLAAPITQVVTVGAGNVRLNFIAGQPSPPPPPSGVPSNLGTVAETFTHATESYSYFVTQAYQRYLGRGLDASGLNYWVDQMQHHALTDERLEAGFLGAPEYIANHGGTGSGWVQGMYRDLLGREPDAQGLAFWVTQLQAGANPADVAYGFAASAERESQRIDADYRALLDRPADAGGLNFWLNAFLHGSTNEDLVGGFVGSDEYYNASNKGHGNRAAWVAAAFDDVFNRAASTNEINYWSGVLV